jgi:allose kinase
MSSANILVLDIGGTKVRLGHCERGSVARHTLTVATAELKNGEPHERLSELIARYAKERAQRFDQIVIGLPSTVDRPRGIVVRAHNWPELEGIELSRQLQNRLGCPVHLEHDAALLALGEWSAGAGERRSRVLNVFFGTGIGACFLLNGTPFRRHVTGLELGHLPAGSEGRSCICGRTDCFESYASGRILAAFAEEAGIDLISLFHSSRADVQAFVAEFVRFQARALVTALVLLDPELVVLGGGVLELAGYPFESLTRYTIDRLPSSFDPGSVRFVPARLGQLASIYGGLALFERAT